MRHSQKTCRWHCLNRNWLRFRADVVIFVLKYAPGPDRAVGRNFQNSCWQNGKKAKHCCMTKKFKDNLIKDRDSLLRDKENMVRENDYFKLEKEKMSREKDFRRKRKKRIIVFYCDICLDG